jgi:hypothetical protein
MFLAGASILPNSGFACVWIDAVDQRKSRAGHERSERAGLTMAQLDIRVAERGILFRSSFAV